MTNAPPNAFFIKTPTPLLIVFRALQFLQCVSIKKSLIHVRFKAFRQLPKTFQDKFIFKYFSNHCKRITDRGDMSSIHAKHLCLIILKSFNAEGNYRLNKKLIKLRLNKLNICAIYFKVLL